jgi:8-oxo-dGTP pyrophosphatase MutT (NUDIX family)
MRFERIGEERVWEGKIASVRVEQWRLDGEEVTREVVSHPGAVAVVAHDGERIYLVTQPREPVREEALLELPAGKLDEEGEDVLTTAKRELAEEIGKGARTWEHLTTFYSSPGFSDEVVHVYLATELYDEKAAAAENERIEICPVPLAELDDAIADCRDAKSLVGLLWFRAYRDGGP